MRRREPAVVGGADVALDAGVPAATPGAGDRGQGIDRGAYARPATTLSRTRARHVVGAEWLPTSAIVLNVSAEGLLVGSDRELFLGDLLELDFDLPSGSADLRVRVEVVRVERLEGAVPVWLGGCQLQEADSETRAMIAG